MYLQRVRVRFVYEGHRVKAKVTGAKKVDSAYSHSVKQCSTTTPIQFPQCENSIVNNSNSVTHRAVKFACSVGFSAATDQVMWPPSLLHDRMWIHVTKCMHSRVVGLGLEGSLVTSSTATATTTIRPDQPSLPPESVNEYQLRLGRQRQVWFIPLVDEHRVCR